MNNDKQANCLTRFAQSYGYPNLQAFLMSWPEEFFALAASWRCLRSGLL
jgi:hypothetical protein